MGVSPIFRVLAVAGFIQAVETTRGLIMLSCGLSKRYFLFGVGRSVVLVASFVLGLPWGAIGVAAGFTIGDYLIMLPSLWYCFKGTPVTVTAFMQAITRPAIAALCSSGSMYLVYIRFLYGADDILAIAVSLFVGIVSYLSLWVIMPAGLTTLYEFFQLAASLVTSRKGKREGQTQTATID